MILHQQTDVLRCRHLMEVVPAGGSSDVPVGATMEIGFNDSLQAGMEDFMALHEGDLSGPEVPGTWTRSMGPTGGMVLSFAPTEPLKSSTAYAIHIGGAMSDEDGHRVSLEDHGPGMGGQWATQGMMLGDGMGMGPGGNTSHMGAGWQHPNGSYGMAFNFTTG